MCYRLTVALCLALGFQPVPATLAQDFVPVTGALSDEDFYRAVACAAPPGGDCQKRFVRWSRREARDLSIRIVAVDDGYPGRLGQKFAETLETTIDSVNGAGANLQLRRAAEDETPDIRIFLLDLPPTADVRGTGLPWLDGNPLQTARFQLNWRNDGTIIECAIAVSRDVRSSLVQRILLEEITQCLGLVTDIGGSHYETRSIYSETGDVNRMGPQDLMALRRHYP